MDGVGVLHHLPQLGRAGHVQDALVLLVLLGDPQAHIGATGHQLGLRVMGTGLQQRGQAGGGQVGWEGVFI